MEFLFQIQEDAERRARLREMMQSFGLTYICLWFYLDQPLINCLQSFDGIYEGPSSSQASSSSGSRAKQLFDQYRGLPVHHFDRPQVPGHAFRNRNIDPYLELKMPELESLVYSQEQLQFYREARIQTVVFIGCTLGEIEMGMSTDPPIDLKPRMESLFQTSRSMERPQWIDPNQQLPSSSSSSLRSLSVDDSIENPPLFFNIPSTSFIQEPQTRETLLDLEAVLTAATVPPPHPPEVSSPHQEAIQDLSQMRNVRNPSIEVENATIMKAILTVLSSSSSSSSSPQQTAPQNFPPIGPARGNRPTAFKGYRGALAPLGTATRRPSSSFKKALVYLRNLHMVTRESQFAQAGHPRPMTPQSWQHTIQERKRRQKINESFGVLRSLLPPGSKKDKASVLSSTTEYLSYLKNQVADLIKKNQMLESQLKSVPKFEKQEAAGEASSSTAERVTVQTAQVSSSGSEARFLDLRVVVRGECIMLDLVIRLLEFLKRQRNLNLMSLESNFRVFEQNIPVHGVMLRLKIEDDEFDEAAFLEAVRRAVDE